MRKLIVSVHSTANCIITGPPSDETNFMEWAQSGIEDSLDGFLKSLASVDTILLGRATYEDLVRKWPRVREWPHVSEVALRIGEKINATAKVVVTGTLERLVWGEFEPPRRLTGTSISEQIKGLKDGEGSDIITFGARGLCNPLRMPDSSTSIGSSFTRLS